MEPSAEGEGQGTEAAETAAVHVGPTFRAKSHDETNEDDPIPAGGSKRAGTSVQDEKGHPPKRAKASEGFKLRWGRS